MPNYFIQLTNNYWNAENVKLNEIHFFPIDNTSREDLMFRSGQLHVTSTVPPEKVEVYREQYPDTIHIDPYYGTYYYRFNTMVKPGEVLKRLEGLD